MPRPPLQLAGQKFDMLTPLEIVGHYNRKMLWRCRCDCGQHVDVPASAIRSGSRTSCGCKKRLPRGPRSPEFAERMRIASATHGMSGTPAWHSWQAMRSRCLNPTDKDYRNYGARGITVCDIWSDFSVFLRDMGERPAGTTIDRIDVNGNYEPGNCRWATPAQQGRNTRVNVQVTFNGKTQCVAEWAEEVGLERKTLEYRIRIGWTPERALTTPSLIKRK